MKRKLEIVTNVSIAVLCLVVSSVLIKKHFYSSAPPEQVQVLRKGQVVNLPETLRSDDAKIVMVAALAPGCGYCNESMIFYRALSTQLSKEADLRIVATVRAPDQVEEEREVLADAGVDIEEVVVTDFKAMGIPGTPMLIAADRQGRVLGAWLGRLDQAQEQDVLRTLGLADETVQASSG